MNRLRIGTCSWKYASWKGLVYTGNADLGEYARKYDTVEVDQWFWSLFPKGKIRLPDPADAAAYREAVPGNFRFTVKVPNSVTLTHAYSRERNVLGPANGSFLSAELFNSFLASVKPLHGLLGPLIFQFEYLNRKKMASQQTFEKAFAEFRKHLPPKFDYALEIRNGNYLNARFFGFLLEQEVIPVLLQGYWMPPVPEVHERFADSLGKFHSVVMRLHGPDRGAIEEETGGVWDRIVRPRDDELDRLAAVVNVFLERGASVYVNVNNHYEGSAPLTIERFRKRLGV
jgi:uncharacterized protein YecE (DUF72 family)